MGCYVIYCGQYHRDDVGQNGEPCGLTEKYFMAFKNRIFHLGLCSTEEFEQIVP